MEQQKGGRNNKGQGNNDKKKMICKSDFLVFKVILLSLGLDSILISVKCDYVIIFIIVCSKYLPSVTA